MQFVDHVRVYVAAGRGGDGMVAWRREKYVPRGGPAGGDGGTGGDVIFVADAHLSTLLDLRYRQRLKAEHGRPGSGRDRNGRGGVDLIVRVPVGTVVTVEAVGELDASTPIGGGLENVIMVEPGDGPQPYLGLPADDGADEPDATSDEDRDDIGDHRDAAMLRNMEPRETRYAPGDVVADLTEEGQQIVVARGGGGGRGNIHFRSSTNRSPDRAEPGQAGECLSLRLELRLLADVGMVGYPNVGKSTFISKVSRARPKVADYPFTTLVPQLGVVRLGEGRSMVVADIPGLIDGASEGRGLGHQFLRHLERTRVLLHMLAPDPTEGREPLVDLDALELELDRYGAAFEGRPRVVALNKRDLLTDEAGREQISELRATLRARNIPLFVISAHTGAGVDKLLEAIWRRIEMAHVAEAAAAAA
ncbi:MAG: GTPase ObgE, partial [Nannocystaceae bacterium]|nr:GTPase ObgE [Nannocystaceae bacterium]